MTQRAGYQEVNATAAPLAHAHFWDGYAAQYLAEHGDHLGRADLLWCPEGLRESQAHLLGDVAGRRVIEIGCGAGQGTRWVTAQGGSCVGIDISHGMLQAGRELDAVTGVRAATVRADAAHLPFCRATFDVAFSAFGALPFLRDLGEVHREVARVLRPGGRWVFSVTHPVRWSFPDDPGPGGLVATRSYFDETPYAEYDDGGRLEYVEFHHTLTSHVEQLLSAGFYLERLLEPQWEAGLTHVWGGWSPTRGALLPGTLILVGRLAPAAGGTS